jgi:uncharacterized membrane protein HdeD (DUF308 family)
MAGMGHGHDATEKITAGTVRTKERLETAGWGLLLAWSGALILLPGDLALLWHIWLVGVGVIVLGAALVAVRLGSRPSLDSWILGVVALVSGLAGLIGVSISVIGLGLLAFGLAFLVAVIRPSVVRHLPASTATRDTTA